MSKQAVERNQLGRNNSILKRIMTTLSVVMFLIAITSTHASAQNGASMQGSGKVLGQATVIDPCTDEMIPMDLNTSLSYTVVNNGPASHAQAHIELDGTGTGTPSGSKYTLHGVHKADVDIAPDAAGNFEITLGGTAELVSQGSAPNLSIHHVFHIVLTPSGAFHVLHDMTSACRT